MSFSAHEMLVFLRVRDEASRTLNRFSDNIRKATKTELLANNKVLRSHGEAFDLKSKELALVQEVGRKEVASISSAIRKTQDSVKIRQGQLATYGLQRAEIIKTYQAQSDAVKATSALTAKEKQEFIAMYNMEKRAALQATDAEMTAIKHVILTEKDHIRVLGNKKIEAAETSASHVRGLKEELRYIKKLQREESERVGAEMLNQRNIDEANMLARKHNSALGMAYTTTGAAIAGVGIVSVLALDNAADASIKYRQEATKTFTQVDGVAGVTLDTIVKYGRQAADKFAIPMDDIQGSLYDLFSSMEFKNGKQAKEMLEQISIATIGGVTDMKSAGTSMIGIMNSYELKVKDAYKVNDLMFQLVRKGVGDYQGLSDQMNIAGPSAQKAGQSYKQTAGMIAFMTRSGMKFSRVGTFAGRALDAMSNPRVSDNMKELGIKVYDAHGKMRPMVKIVNDMKKSMKGMNDEQKNAQLKSMFQGAGGSIQAMKFFNTAMNDNAKLVDSSGKKVNLYNKLMDDMKHSTGAAKDAFNEMKKTDSNKLVESANDIKIAFQEIGDIIAPIKTAIQEFIGNIAEAFNKLSPEMKNFIVIGAAVSAAIGIISGALIAGYGAVLLFNTAIAASELTLGLIAAPVLAVVAAIAALVVIGWLIYDNWEIICQFLSDAWNAVVANLQPQIDFLGGLFEQLGNVFNTLGGMFKGVWDKIVETFNWAMSEVNKFLAGFNVKGFEDGMRGISEFAQGLWHAITWIFSGIIAAISSFVTAFVAFFSPIIAAVATFVGGFIAPMVAGIIGAIQGLWAFLSNILGAIGALFQGKWAEAGQFAIDAISGLFAAIVSLIYGAVSGIAAALSNLVQGIINFFVYLWDVLVGHSIVPDLINSIIQFFSELPGKVLTFVSDLVSKAITFFSNLRDSLLEKVRNAISSTVNFFSELPGKVIGAVSSLVGSLGKTAGEWISGVLTVLGTKGLDVIQWFKDLPGKLLNGLGNVGNILVNAGKSIIEGLWNGLKSMWDNVTGWFSGIADWIREHKGPISYDLKLLEPAGNAIMYGLNKQLKAGFDETKRIVNTGTDIFNDTNLNRAAFGTSSYGQRSSSNIYNIDTTVHTQEIDPRKHSADLGYEISQRLGL